MAGIDRHPEEAAAVAALVVFAVLRAEEKLVDLARVPDAVLREGRLNGLQAVRAEIRLLVPVPDHGGPLHVAVPGLLLGDDGVDAPVALFVQVVEPVQFRVAAHHHAGGVRQGLADLPRPFVGHMGGAQDHIKSLLQPPAGLLRPQGVHGGHGRGADLRLAGPALCNNKAALVLLQLALHRLGHGKLGIVEGIARVLPDIVVHSQNLRRERLAGRVEERLELPADALGYRYAEGVQVAGDILHAVKAVRVDDRPGDGDGPAFEAVLHHGDDVGIILPAIQHPGVQLLPQGDDLEPFQNSPALQFIQHIVPKLRDQRHRCFPVHLFKEAVPVVFRTKDDALARRQVHFLLSLLLFIPLFAAFGGLRLLVIVNGQKRRLGIHAVMGDLPAVPPGLAFQP